MTKSAREVARWMFPVKDLYHDQTEWYTYHNLRVISYKIDNTKIIAINKSRESYRFLFCFIRPTAMYIMFYDR